MEEKEIVDYKLSYEKHRNSDMYKLQQRWLNLYQNKDETIHNTTVNVQGKDVKKEVMSLHMPTVATYEMASLICNEAVDLNFEDDSHWDFVADTILDEKYLINLQHNLEQAFALGGLAVEIYKDEKGTQLNYINALNIIPLKWDCNKEITDVSFKIEEIVSGEYIYTLFRRHEWIDGIYTISNDLYKASKSDTSIGELTNLSEIYPDLEPELRFPAAERSFWAYFKPNVANNKDLDSPLGVSLYRNSLDTLKSIDIKYDSLTREFELGKKRIIVPREWLRRDVNHNAYHDTNDEVFVGLGDIDNVNFMDVNIQLRVQEHIDAINNDLDQLATQMGFTAGTFTFDNRGLKTATQVVSENSKTFKSKKSHEIMVEQFIKETVWSIFEIEKCVNGISIPEDIDLTVDFDDSIVEDKQTELEQEILKVNNGLTTKKLAIMAIHKVGEDEAEAILQEIRDENQEVSGDLMDRLLNGEYLHQYEEEKENEEEQDIEYNKEVEDNE